MTAAQKIIYSEILQGYSTARYKDRYIYIKHLNGFDSYEANLYENEQTEKAKKFGLKTYQERLDELIETKVWTKESRISALRDTIKNTEKAKTQLSNYGLILAATKGIERDQAEIDELVRERDGLVGQIIEHFIHKKVNEYHIYVSCFSDKNLTTSFFTKEEFLSLEDEELNELITIYNTQIGRLAGDNIKKIAIDSEVRTLLSLAGDNLYYLTGKPINRLSYYQIELFTYTRSFNNIINNGQQEPPDEVLSHPDKLMDWYHALKNTTQKAPPREKLINDGKGKSFDVGSLDYSKYMKPGQSIGLQEVTRMNGQNILLKTP